MFDSKVDEPGHGSPSGWDLGDSEASSVREEMASSMVESALSELFGNEGPVPSGVWAV